MRAPNGPVAFTTIFSVGKVDTTLAGTGPGTVMTTFAPDTETVGVAGPTLAQPSMAWATSTVFAGTATRQTTFDSSVTVPPLEDALMVNGFGVTWIRNCESGATACGAVTSYPPSRSSENVLRRK